MLVEVRTQKMVFGRAEVVNRGKLANGDSRYQVRWTGPNGEVLQFDVRHDRRKGAWALAEKVCRRVRKEMERFYSIPKDKVVDGLVRDSDIPERWRKAFGKWLGIATVSLVSRKPCPEGCLDVDLDKKEETASNASDVYGFLDAMLYGKCKVWD